MHPDATQDATPLTLEETCQLRAIGPTRYRQQVISLFASGQATEVQWDALATVLARAWGHATGRLDVQLFRDRQAAQHQWQTMATLVWLYREAGDTAQATLIDRAILTRHAAHEAGRDAWGRWPVG